ncbi:HI0074 family nucleotidyltransferase substrate-binding subunit [Terasakiella sp. A23]|uniref:HI0074 family nucleotidyltransferase substrate-binding subunit n=1 Tax=Terasakiella sp. FCG-A23 TaxID=3080561 RepID=UPI002953DF69|nr:HI0074 family nucleotidyltransferase substrate-binding subunit [Terasakiella sp. A23]MDV7341813.1 HI0074 family nucleotidyltransferase substrate-binding subunit [Terasakiella sp. A23]
MLIVTSFEKALKSLKEGLDERRRCPDNVFVRDAVIQRFEYTYEISHRMLKRYLESISANPSEIDGLAFQGLIRLGCEKGLLRSDWERWKLYRTARGTVSHTYDEDKAKEVLEIVPDFYEEAKFLLIRISGGAG